MPANVEALDRLIRIAIGIALLGAVFFFRKLALGGADRLGAVRHRTDRLVSGLRMADQRLKHF